MSREILPEQIETMTLKMTHDLTVALIIFSVAWFCLTVGVFTVNPVGPIGIFFLCVGLLCVAMSIFYFVCYASISKKLREAAHS